MYIISMSKVLLSHLKYIESILLPVSDWLMLNANSSSFSVILCHVLDDWMIDWLMFNANSSSISALSWHVLDDWTFQNFQCFLNLKIFKTWFYMKKNPKIIFTVIQIVYMIQKRVLNK
jgi:hypothetical protein